MPQRHRALPLVHRAWVAAALTTIVGLSWAALGPSRSEAADPPGATETTTVTQPSDVPVAAAGVGGRAIAVAPDGTIYLATRTAGDDGPAPGDVGSLVILRPGQPDVTVPDLPLIGQLAAAPDGSAAFAVTRFLPADADLPPGDVGIIDPDGTVYWVELDLYSDPKPLTFGPDGTLYVATQYGLYALPLDWVRSTWHAECDAAPVGTCAIASTSVPTPVPLYSGWPGIVPGHPMVAPDGSAVLVPNAPSEGDLTIIRGGAVTAVLALGYFVPDATIGPDGVIHAIVESGSATELRSFQVSGSDTMVGVTSIDLTGVDPAPQLIALAPDGTLYLAGGFASDPDGVVAVVRAGALAEQYTVAQAPTALAVTPSGAVLLLARDSANLWALGTTTVTVTSSSSSTWAPVFTVEVISTVPHGDEGVVTLTLTSGVGPLATSLPLVNGTATFDLTGMMTGTFSASASFSPSGGGAAIAPASVPLTVLPPPAPPAPPAPAASDPPSSPAPPAVAQAPSAPPSAPPASERAAPGPTVLGEIDGPTGQPTSPGSTPVAPADDPPSTTDPSSPAQPVDVADRGPDRATNGSAELSVFGRTLRTPDLADLDVGRLVTNLTLTAATMLLILFPAELFDSTLRNNYDRITAWFAGRRRQLRRRWRPGPAARAAGSVAFLGAGALLASMVNPGFGLNGTTARLWLVDLLVLTFVVFAGNWSFLAVLGHHRQGASIAMRPLAIVVCIGCVLVSRLAHIEPGYFYGLVAGLRLAPGIPKRRAGWAMTGSTAFLLACAVVAWVALGPVRQAATTAHPSLVAIFGAEALTALAVGILTALSLSLLPFSFFDGYEIFAWKKWVWASTYGIVLLAFLSIVARPAWITTTSTTPQAVWVSALIAFAALSLATWTTMRRRAVEAPAA